MNINRLRIEKLLEACDVDKKPLPHLDPDEFDGGPEEIANWLRSLWKLPKGPVQNMTQIVEDAGCVVVHFDFGTKKLDGLSIWSRNDVPIIFLNPTLSAARMRLTLAHEIGHIVMHRIPGPNMEDQAMRFAGEFLMPEIEIKSQFLPVNVDRLARLKLAWKVSMQSLLIRGEHIGVITSRHARYIWMQLGKYGYRAREPHDDQIQREIPRLMNELVMLHLEELHYSPDDLADTLGMTIRDFRREILGSPAGLEVVK
jgi:Zn-dependent peptidase ImmA (M78 family)